jgi:hypothetical protein
MLDALHARAPGVDRVLLLLEDFFLTEPVRTDTVLHLARIAHERRIGCIRLVAGLPLAIPPPESAELPGMGRIGHGDAYRVTLQASLWSIATLRKLLSPGMTPWEFEHIGSHASIALDEEFWGVTRSALVYDHALEKGRWKPNGLAIVERAGLAAPAGRGLFAAGEFAAYLKRSEEEAAVTVGRNAALRSFLTGRRREGLRSLWRYGRQRGIGAAELALAGAGILGRRATRAALDAYVGLRLRICARREVRGL